MSGTQGVMRIGEVHAQLRKDFPDVELSKIRYYEDKGLVQPSRSRKGYRLYSERDVACLREAIRLAHEEFVPLRVVRLRLIEQGLLDAPHVTPVVRHAAREAVSSVRVAAPVTETPVPRESSVTPLPAPRTEPRTSEVATREYFTVHDLLATTGLTPEEFNQLQSLGLVTPIVRGDETLYAAIEVRCAALARALLARGIDVRLVGSLRRIVEREVGIVEDIIAALCPPGSKMSSREFDETCAHVAHDVGALRAVLLERALLESRRA